MPADDKVVDKTPDGNAEAGAADAKDKKDAKDKRDPQENMSEEDKQLLATLTELLTIVIEPSSTENHTQIQRVAMEKLQTEIKSSTASMTSIPKPLKFLKSHWSSLVEYHDAMESTDPNKPFFADILSVLAMTQASNGEKRLTLNYKLKGDKSQEIGVWGHEYVRQLSGEIGREHSDRVETQNLSAPFSDLNALIDQIVPFFITHHAEFDAIDLLIEVEQLEKVATFFQSSEYDKSFQRVCAYISKCAEYIIDLDEQKSFFQINVDIYVAHHQYADALRMAIRMNSVEQMNTILNKAVEHDINVAKQCALILGSHRISLEEYREHPVLGELMGNQKLSSYFHRLAADLDVKEAKTPEDIYKSHLEEGTSMFGRRPRPVAASTVDNARQNLSATFVNGCVNCAFGSDTLLLPENSDWLYKNKATGVLSATASLGLLLLWDTENGISIIDRYSFSNQSSIKAGTNLALGIISCGIYNEMDAVFALLSEQIETTTDAETKICSLLGLGFAYLQSHRSDLLELLVPIIMDSTQPIDVVAHSFLSLGLIFLGSANEEIFTTMLESLSEHFNDATPTVNAQMMAFGMALLFFGKGVSECEPIFSALQIIPNESYQQYVQICVTTFASAGSNSPLEIQKYMTMLGTNMEAEEKKKKAEAESEEKKDGTNATADESDSDTLSYTSLHQSSLLYIISLLSLYDPLSTAMTYRLFDHLLQYTPSIHVKRSLPLAYAFLSLSNPNLSLIDLLTKLSHDSDEGISQNAILALGLIGAGTNNSRIAVLLRTLATYYAKDANHLFLVRLAQGLLHLGKGLLSISPFQSDGFTTGQGSLASLLLFFMFSTNMKDFLLTKKHYLFYLLTPAIHPRHLMTVDSDLNPITVQVRVGQKVDTVGQAGAPKSITGFQTHDTPVLIGANERAELATEEYIPLTNVLEGMVILKKNPDYRPNA